MSFEDDARKVVLALMPGASIQDVRIGTQAVTVTTDMGSRTVRDVSEAYESGDSYRVLSVSPAEMSDPPARPDGFALTPDGGVYHLNDPAQLNAFWRAAHEHIEPLDLALMLASYQSEAAGRETIVMQAADLGVEETTSASVPPDIASSGPLMMRFLTQHFVTEPPDYVSRRRIIEWSVRQDDAGDLDWFWSPISPADI